MTSGFTAFYLATYCVHYFVTKLEIEGAASTFLYFGYTSIIVFLFFLLTGELPFLVFLHFAISNPSYSRDIKLVCKTYFSGLASVQNRFS